MSENESRINKGLVGSEPPMLPGLFRDHKDLKKERIIDTFLAQSTSNRVPVVLPPYRSLH